MKGFHVGNLSSSDNFVSMPWLTTVVDQPGVRPDTCHVAHCGRDVDAAGPAQPGCRSGRAAVHGGLRG